MRVNQVQHARKAQGRCSRCGDDIAVGDPYRHWKSRYGPRLVRCMRPECSPRPSELITNEELSRLTAAQEDATAAILAASDDDLAEDFVEDLRSALEDAASEAEEVAESYREKQSNIEDGFGHETEQSAEFEEKADQVDSWADELGNADLNEYDEDDTIDRDDWAQSQRDVAQEAVDALDVY